jgi:hypothetical protein
MTMTGLAISARELNCAKRPAHLAGRFVYLALSL